MGLGSSLEISITFQHFEFQIIFYIIEIALPKRIRDSNFPALYLYTHFIKSKQKTRILYFLHSSHCERCGHHIHIAVS